MLCRRALLVRRSLSCIVGAWLLLVALFTANQFSLGRRAEPLRLKGPSQQRAGPQTIEQLAAYVRRLGPGVEQITRQKNPSNPRFRFLPPGGEGSEYYEALLSKED